MTQVVTGVKISLDTIVEKSGRTDAWSFTNYLATLPSMSIIRDNYYNLGREKQRKKNVLKSRFINININSLFVKFIVIIIMKNQSLTRRPLGFPLQSSYSQE